MAGKNINPKREEIKNVFKNKSSASSHSTGAEHWFSPFRTGGLEEAMFLTNGSGIGVGQIKWVARVIDDDTVELTEPLDADVAAVTTAYTMINPFLFETKAATSLPPAGIACATFAAGEYGWFQQGGICPVLADSSEDQILLGQVVTQSLGAAGLIEGPSVSGAPTATDLHGAIGVAMIDGPLSAK